MNRQTIKKNDPSTSNPGVILRFSLVISLFFHALFLVTLQNTFPFQWSLGEYRSYTVDLIRPPVVDLPVDDVLDNDVSQIEEEKQLPDTQDEETISLNTDDKRYVSYAKMIKQRILRQWKYPGEAKEQLLEGKLLVIFSLVKIGDVIQAKILESSGHEILDQEALRAITSAAPFPTFPEQIAVVRLNIKANFDYRLTRK